MSELSCPDCGDDPNDPSVHADGCPRIDTMGQFGPPWPDPPWAPMCRPDGIDVCVLEAGHTGPHWKERYA